MSIEAKSFVITEKKKNCLNVTLNRPDVHNAFNAQMIKEVTQAFKSVDKTIHAVVLNGNGKSFCAGADLEYMRSMTAYRFEENVQDSTVLFEMFETIFNCPVPVLAQVHGSALGGGLGLVGVCDIVAAEKDARFGFTEVRFGIVPAVISPFIVRKVPEHFSREMMMTGEFFNCTKAEKMGLVHFFGEAEEVGDYIQSKIDFINNNGPEAVRAVKSLIQSLPNWNWDQAKSETVRLIAERRVSEEGQEGLRAFLAKRSPKWKTT